MYANYISSNITTVPTDETKAVNQLTPILSKLGFSVREARAGQDYIIINNNKGVESEAIDLTDSGAAESIKSFLIGNVPGADETEKVMYISNLAKKGVLGGAQGQPKQQGVGAKYNK